MFRYHIKSMRCAALEQGGREMQHRYIERPTLRSASRSRFYVITNKASNNPHPRNLFIGESESEDLLHPTKEIPCLSWTRIVPSLVNVRRIVISITSRRFCQESTEGIKKRSWARPFKSSDVIKPCMPGHVKAGYAALLSQTYASNFTDKICEEPSSAIVTP